MVERDLVDVVERELAQVHLPVLSVAQLDAVVEHAHVVAAHRTHVHRLQPPYPTIVLELHTTEVAYGIGHAMAVEPLEHLATEHLRRDDLAVRLLGIDNHLAQILHRVEAGVAHSQAVLGPTAHDGHASHHQCHVMSHFPGLNQRLGRSSDSSLFRDLPQPSHDTSGRVTVTVAGTLQLGHTAAPSVGDSHPVPFSPTPNRRRHQIRLQRY